MPWAVQGLTFAYAATMAAVQTLIFLYVPRELWSQPALRLSIVGGYAIAAGLFAWFPWNPYTEKPSGLSISERRVLVACYAPATRWSAVRAVLPFAAVPLLLSVLAEILPLGVFTNPNMRLSAASAMLLVISIVIGSTAGFYGLTEPLRKAWSTLTASGPAWPASFDYPGSRIVAFKSLLTGTLPSFLVDEGSLGES